jgi:acyl-CoA reductase-like NAD-dependent aldehyde dehydrogenase
LQRGAADPVIHPLPRTAATPRFFPPRDMIGTLAPEERVMTPSDRVAALLAAARAAQESWARASVAARAGAVRRARERLIDRAAEAADLLESEVGKPRCEALTAEVAANVDLFDFWLGAARRLLAPERVRLSPLNYPKKRAAIERAPAGVVGLIAPWNFPIALPLRTIVPALLAGNAVIFKPSEIAPRAGAFVVSLFDGALPAGLLALLEGGAEAGEALAGAAVDRLVFTGSVATGRKVAAAAAARLTPCSLELGGKDAAIVLADCDIARTAAGLVWGAFYNAGQNCASIERAFIERPVFDAIAAAVTARARALAAGPGGDLPPLASERQLAKVKAHVDDAVARGARLLAGGKPLAGTRFFEPTVLTDIPAGATILEEETFGPVLTLTAVGDAEEAVRRANACRYGLTGSVWTRDLARGEALARRLETGVATVNNHSFTGAVPALPWTGVKETGGGVTGSRHALSFFTRPRTILVDRGDANGPGRGEVWWYPYTETLAALALGTLDLARGGLFTKGRAALRLLPLLKQRTRELAADAGAAPSGPAAPPGSASSGAGPS